MKDPKSASIGKSRTSSARNRMMDYLSQREHSEKELRAKLIRLFPENEVVAAIEFGQKKGWIAQNPKALSELSERTAATLIRRGKGPHYIAQYLEEKGLPPIEISGADESTKAMELMRKKLETRAGTSKISMKDPKQQEKWMRFLLSRGFSTEVVESVIREILSAP